MMDYVLEQRDTLDPLDYPFIAIAKKRASNEEVKVNWLPGGVTWLDPEDDIQMLVPIYCGRVESPFEVGG